MKSITALSMALAALCAVPAAFADDQTSTSTTTTQTAPNGTAAAVGDDGSTTYTVQPPPTTYTVQPPVVTSNAPAVTTTTSTTTAHDEVERRDIEDRDRRPRVRPGFGLNVFGTLGSTNDANYGLGGRVEFVMPFGLTLGGSYTQHWTNDSNRSALRPLLGEIGVAIPVVKGFEIRPMVGLGYAFVSSSGTTNTNNTGTANQTQTSSVSVATAGFDVAPGAKISWLPGTDGAAFEVYTLPKYHFISGENFFGIELGAGARF